MKLMILAAVATLTMIGQTVTSPSVNAKVAPEMKAPQPAERALTETEVLKLRADMAEISKLQTAYKLGEYQQKVQPKFADEEEVFTKACESIGIAKEKAHAECSLNIGLDDDGNPILDATGKPVKPRVWKIEPPAKAK
jgi:hypothetical protein